MKILQLNFEAGWRGGERQTLYNMLGFRDAGQEVVLVCRKGFPLEKKAMDQGFKVFAFPNVFGVIAYLIRNTADFDIIHSQTSHILTYCIATKIFHKKKILFTRRVDFVPHGKLTKLKYLSTDILIAISTAIKDIISNFSGRNDVKLISDIAVAKKLDVERVNAELIKNGIERSKHIIGTTAALVPHKDPLTMVEAIREVASVRKDFVFLHFGSGHLKDEVERKIAEYDLQSQYKLMGYFDNVEDFFSVFEVFVMSSQEEGLGSSILDAFLYKVPVVSTDAGGIKDLVTEDRGMVCKVKDFCTIAERIMEVLDKRNNPELITNAFTYVNAFHSIEYITCQYLKVLSRLS